ncbi:MAG: TolC family protein, partial [Candidatus Woesearchaeota archaeon]
MGVYHRKLQVVGNRSYALSLPKSWVLANRLTNHHTLQITEKNNDLIIRESWREFFPTLTLSYLQTEEVRERALDSRQHKLSIDASITIYDGGKRKHAYNAAQLKSILAANEYRIALNNLIATITKAYLGVLQARDIIAIHELTLSQGKMQLSFIQKEFALGDATKLDALAIEAKVKEMELNLEKAKNDLVHRINQFKLLLKIDRTVPLIIFGNIEKDFQIFPPDERIDEDLLIALALKNRKEIESANAEYKLAMNALHMSETYYLPQLSLGFNYNLSDQEFFPREKGWGISVQISSALFGNSGSMNTAINESANSNSKAFSNSVNINVLDSLSYKRAILENTIQFKTATEKRKQVQREIALEVSSLVSS